MDSWKMKWSQMLVLATMTLALAGNAAAEDPSWDEDRSRVSIVTNGWVDVREILRTVAINADLGLQLAPDVEGSVNVHLENVKVSRALEALLGPADLGYEVVDDVLVVYGRGLITRWFTFDYPVTEREGRGELAISVARESESGGGGGENQNKSHVKIGRASCRERV